MPYTHMELLSGRLPVMLWNELTRAMAEGDCNVANIVLPDRRPGESLAVPARTPPDGNVKACKMESEGGYDSSKKRLKKRHHEKNDKNAGLVSEFKGLLRTIASTDTTTEPRRNLAEDEDDTFLFFG